jgi:quercetin dioxygenase-like cupin family protein
MEILRFGPGHRRLGGPPGTQNVEGQVIMHDKRAVVSELAFGRYAIMTPHSNPENTALFVVISGAGFVQVGDERARINHGEAVIWPPDEIHGAYTDGTEMRAIVVELVGDGQTHFIEGTARPATEAADSESSPGAEPRATPAEGSLAERKVTRDEYDASEGEPW